MRLDFWNWGKNEASAQAFQVPKPAVYQERPQRPEEVPSQELADELRRAGAEEAVVQAYLDGNIDFAHITSTKKDKMFLMRTARMLPEMIPRHLAGEVPTPLGRKPRGDFRSDDFSRGEGRYVQFASQLGKGGMGEVREGWDTRINAPVVIKGFLPGQVFSEIQQTNLLREARATGRFTHPNVVKVYDITVDTEGRPCYVMEKLGKDYRELGDLTGHLSQRQFFQIGGQLASVIDSSAAENLFHFDLKPSNIMADHNFQVKVLDYGIANLVFESDTPDVDLYGTPNYLSPELIKTLRDLKKRERLGEDVSEKIHEISYAAELFHVGSIVFELITGYLRWQVSKSDSLTDILQRINLSKSMTPEQRAELIKCAEKMGMNGEQVVGILEDAWQKDPYKRLHSFIEPNKGQYSAVGGLMRRLAQAVR